MKRIKNGKNFVFAITMLGIGVVCFILGCLRDMETRFFLAGLLLFAWSAIQFFSAFRNESRRVQTDQVTDERDNYIVMKSGWKALTIANYGITLACFVSGILYGILHLEFLLPVTITLCAVLVGILLALFLTNLYYEKHE